MKKCVLILLILACGSISFDIKELLHFKEHPASSIAETHSHEEPVIAKSEFSQPPLPACGVIAAQISLFIPLESYSYIWKPPVLS